MFKEGGPLPGPKSELLFNTQTWIIRGDKGKLERLYWEGARGWKAVGSGKPVRLLCHVARSLEFCGVGISFWVCLGRSLWLKPLPDSVHVAQPRYQREGFWEVIRYVASPSGLSQTLLVGGDLLVPCSLPGPPVIEKLTQMITRVLGQGDRFQSMGFPYHQGVIVTSAHFFSKTLQSEEYSLYPGERSIFISKDKVTRSIQTDLVSFPSLPQWPLPLTLSYSSQICTLCQA